MDVVFMLLFAMIVGKNALLLYTHYHEFKMCCK